MEDDTFIKPIVETKQLINYIPNMSFVNCHKNLLNFGMIQNMMSTEQQPDNTGYKEEGDYDPFIK